MRIQHNLYKNLRFFCVLLLSLLISAGIRAQKNPGKKVTKISVSLKVTDENGSPVSEANVVIGEGITHTTTDANGNISFLAYPDDFVTISATGYEKQVTLVRDFRKDNTIRLVKAKLFMSSDDDILLPYNTVQKKRFVTGSTNVLTSDQLEKYPSNDLRNAFTGLVPGVNVTEYNGSTGITAEEKLGVYGITDKIGVSARGRNLRYIIDGIPVDITEMPLDPEQIESVTIIKDIAEKAMFGPIGADGIILIKTKRGRTNERILTVNAERGITVIDRFPGWTSGADYASLNNQARTNSELTPLYSSADISAYAKGDPYDMYHPNVNYRDMMLQNTKSFTRANVSSSGGNNIVQYSAYLGYNGEGDIYKIGSTADYNRLTASSNLDIKINEDFKVKFDILGSLSLRRSPNFQYATSEGSTYTDLLELNSALPLINNTPPIAFPVYANNSPTLKYPWFGVSPVYDTNPIGALTENGNYTETGRKGNIKFTLDYDFSRIITKGLSSQTFLGYDMYNLTRIGLAKDYSAYTVTPAKTVNGNDTILLGKVHDGVYSNTFRNLHDYYYQALTFFENLRYERTFGIHRVQSSLSFLYYKVSRNGVRDPQREGNAVWTFNYSNKDKYIIQGGVNYTGTPSLDESNRYLLAPSIGLGWVITEENFMTNLKFMNFLKLRAEAGIIGADNFDPPYRGTNRWTLGTGVAFGPYTTNRWFGTTTSTPNISYPSNVGFPGLSWEKSKEISVGLDGLMLNHKLSFEISYYNNLRVGIINQLVNTLPYITGFAAAIPYSNYNSIRYFGWEAGIGYKDKIGEFKYSVGANATVQNTKWEKYNEPQYRLDYQYFTGKPIDSYWGQTYIGKFQSNAEALAVPQLFDAVLKAGDLKYQDINGDGYIDDNDQSAIGHTTPRLRYALNVGLDYKNFELTLIGTGAAFFDIPLTNSYYWNGWEDNNYSNFVKDNIGGAYPRLTYYKVNNNFVKSSFWLTKGDYFKIQNIELAYSIPAGKLQKVRSQGIRLFLRGANLLTISKVKDVDPESINSGVTTYPLYKTFTCGIKLTF